MERDREKGKGVVSDRQPRSRWETS